MAETKSRKTGTKEKLKRLFSRHRSPELSLTTEALAKVVAKVMRDRNDSGININPLFGGAGVSLKVKKLKRVEGRLRRKSAESKFRKKKSDINKWSLWI